MRAFVCVCVCLLQCQLCRLTGLVLSASQTRAERNIGCVCVCVCMRVSFLTLVASQHPDTLKSSYRPGFSVVFCTDIAPATALVVGGEGGLSNAVLVCYCEDIILPWCCGADRL